jgi:phosphate transport system protein
MTTHFVNLLDELRRRSLRMASLVEDMQQEACEALLTGDEALARRVVQRDEEVDREEVAVESEVIRLLALYQPVGSDLRLLCTILKVNNDLERIADCAVNVAERVRRLILRPGTPQLQQIRQLCVAVKQMLREAIQVYASENATAADKVLAKDDTIDALYGQFVRGLIAESDTSHNGMGFHMDVLAIAKGLERIADHATNIAEDVIFLSTGNIVRHQDRARPGPA